MYIVFEGIDGSGKSYQVNRLASELIKRGSKVKLTREPGSEDICFSVRDLVVDSTTPLASNALELLFQADRAEHTQKVFDFLRNGYIVISDRSFISGLAYGLANKHKIDKILPILDFAVDVIPDHVIFLDVKPETGALRMNQGRGAQSREELRGLNHMYSVRKYFMEVIFGRIGRDSEYQLLHQFDDLCSKKRIATELLTKDETSRVIDEYFKLI